MAQPVQVWVWVPCCPAVGWGDSLSPPPLSSYGGPRASVNLWGLRAGLETWYLESLLGSEDQMPLSSASVGREQTILPAFLPSTQGRSPPPLWL